MSNYADKEETVRGIIIGGDHITWRLHYDGVPVWTTLDHYTEAEAMTCATGIKRKLVLADPRKYPDNSKWEMRIYG